MALPGFSFRPVGDLEGQWFSPCLGEPTTSRMWACRCSVHSFVPRTSVYLLVKHRLPSRSHRQRIPEHCAGRPVGHRHLTNTWRSRRYKCQPRDTGRLVQGIQHHFHRRKQDTKDSSVPLAFPLAPGHASGREMLTRSACVTARSILLDPCVVAV